MQDKFLNGILGQQSKLEALRALAPEGAELTGREIARRTGLSHPIVHKALRDLVAEGIVARKDVPPSHQFRLNRNHWVVAEIICPMFEKESGWMEHLARSVARGIPKPVVSVILYGSAVKGGMTPRSDIDVLFLVSSMQQKKRIEDWVFDCGRRVYEAFGHPLAPVILTLTEFRKEHERGREFAKEIGYAGRVIHGKLLTEVLFEHGSQEDQL